MPDNMDGVNDERDPADDGAIFPDAQINVSSSPEAVSTGAPTATADEATEQSADAAAASVESDAAQTRLLYHELWELIRSCAAPMVRSVKWGFLGEDNLLRIDMPPI